MTNETKRRIQFYKDALPGMKSRVFSALMILGIAAVTAVMSTYAWVTLSYSPEVANISTTLSSNGTLEIALSKPDASAPDETDIDESVAYSTDVTVSNLRWGNLINISDASYGIDDLILRPAQLNAASLNNSPLRGAAYGGDGRITDTDSDFTFVTWDPENATFVSSTDKGVRAIASYKYERLDTDNEAYKTERKRPSSAHTSVNNYYKTNVTGKVSTLTSVISTYAQAMINGQVVSAAGQTITLGDGTGNDIPLSKNQVTSVRDMYKALLESMELEKAAMVELANVQQYRYSREHGDAPYSPVTWQDLVSNAKYDADNSGNKFGNPASPTDAIAIKGLTQFKTDLTTATNDVSGLNALAEQAESGTVTSTQLDPYVSRMCAPSKATVDGMTFDAFTSYLKSNITSAGSIVNATHELKLTDGLLMRFERLAVDNGSRLTGYLEIPITLVKNPSGLVSLALSVMGVGQTVKVKGNISTTAPAPCYFEIDLSKLPADINTSSKIAEDTYGMAVDFWVRTNHESTWLLLEGAVVTDPLTGEISSYDGVNRVWGSTENAALTKNSTTQGGGSCYIYYADTPEDASRSLELLKSMKVAFVGSDGTLLAKASMDTDHPYAVNGRYTVPLVLEENTEQVEYTHVDETTGQEETVVESVAKNAVTLPDGAGGEMTVYGIRELTLDHSYMITAIIYIDGETLQNDHVLSSTDIAGQMNIQFSSSEKLNTIGDISLQTAERYVTASVSKTQMDYDTATNDADLTTRVTVNVTGTNPSQVTAFFVRAVNSTQGTRQEVMQFSKQADGSWATDYRFKAPGDYYLRFVRLNGVDYALSEPQKVTVTGFAVTAVNWSEVSNEHTVYTTDSSYNETVSVEFLTTDVRRMPNSVQAKFIRDDGNAVTIDLSYNAASRRWTGSGSFSASGTYTLSYLVLNGNYFDISAYKKELTLYLGLTAEVFQKTGSLMDAYDPDNPEVEHVKQIQISILDNSGNALAGLDNVKLWYAKGGSNSAATKYDLAWNEGTGYYEGEMTFIKPGRYLFYELNVGTNVIRQVRSAPTYVITSPDPPIYDTASISTYHNEPQFIPLETNASIGPIVIANSAGVGISAVIYNSESGSYYEIPMVETANPGRGTMYYSEAAGGWMINLPTYVNDAGKTEIYNGTWSVECISLWDCYDSELGEDGLPISHEENNPMVWLGTSAQATAYARDNNLTANRRIDFSRLSTEVSNKVVISMTPGTTELGGVSAPFMRQYPVANLGMSVNIDDAQGRPIPADKLSGVKLTVSYSAPNDTTYGYEVSSSANKTYQIGFAYEASSGTWIPDSSSNYVWQYVGEYTVGGLTVTVNGSQMIFNAGQNGVPVKYTLTSKAPSGDDMTIGTPTQTTVFGKSGNTVNGQFLQSYVPSTSVPASMTITDADGNQYARVPDMTMKLVLSYLDGTTAPNGAYSWSGSTGYEYYELSMTQDANNNYKVTESKTLLAGRYSAVATLNWTENGVARSRTVPGLSNIEVYSVQPTITITGISPTGTVTVNKNGDGSNSYLVANADTFSAQNHYSNRYAVVYMQYEPFNADNNAATAEGYTHYTHSAEYANYTAPTVRFSASNVGSTPMTMMLSGNGDYSSTVFSSNDTVKTIQIGRVVSNNQTFNEVCSSGLFGIENKANFTYLAENAFILGVKTVESVSSTVGSASFTRYLSAPIFISQTAVQAPKLTIAVTTGLVVSVKQTGSDIGVASGSMVDGMTALTATVTAQEGYYNPRLSKPSGAQNWTVVSEGETESVYTFGMAFEDMTLTGTVAAYPKLYFSSNDKATVAVATDHNIASGTGVKPGTTVTATVTAKTENGYAKPRLTAGSGWTKSEGDYVSTYTFAMPSSATTIPAPTASNMYQVNWTNTAALTFTAVDHSEQDKTISSGDYVIPGHTVIVTVTADGGTNPSLTSPSGAAAYGNTSNAFVRQYSFTMPSGAVTLAGTAEAYPSLVYGNSYASVTLTSSGVAVSTDGATEKGIRPGNTVVITLTANLGYKNPRMTQPAGVENLSANDTTATYSFTMPNSAVNAGSLISATGCTVSYDANGGSVSPSSATYAGSALTLPMPTRAGYKFNGWYTATSGGTKVGNAGAQYTPNEDIPLHAQWTAYTVTYNYNGGSGSPASGTGVVTLPTPSSRTGYTFSGWYTAASGGSKAGDGGASYSPTQNTTLYAHWTLKSYTVSISTSSASVKLTVNSQSVGNGGTIPYNSTVAINLSYSLSSSQTFSVSTTYYSDSNCTKSTKSQEAGTYYFKMPAENVTISASSEMACITGDTLVTLADGTQKPVEEISLNDKILAWDFFTGTAVEKNISLLVFHGNLQCLVKELHFSDGTVLRLIEEHGVFDYDLNRFVYIMPDNYQEYLGHHFAKINPDRTVELVTLDTVELVEEYTGVWSISSAVTSNAVAEGMLTVAPPEAFYNWVTMSGKMEYDTEEFAKDIETYGLYTYDVFKDYVSEKQFVDWNGAYLKIPVEKGLFTFDFVLELIDLYKQYMP